MKALFQQMVSFLRGQVRLLDLLILLLIVGATEMNLTLLSRFNGVIGGILDHEEAYERENSIAVRKLTVIVHDSLYSHPPEAGEAALNSRIKALEQALGESPEKAIVGLTLRKDLENLQQKYQSEMTSMRDEVKTFVDLYKWILGLLAVAVLGPLLLKVFRKE